jgi:hypothetical protein
MLADARGFYLSLLERVFHVKILCLRAVISFSFFVIAYRFCNRRSGQRREVAVLGFGGPDAVTTIGGSLTPFFEAGKR